MELGIKYRKAITLHSSPLSPSGPNLLNTLELAENALPCNASKTILQTSFPPQGLFYQMHDEENGKEKGKKDDVKHCPEVEKKVSPAFRRPPWFFSYLKKRAVPSWVEQVIHYWVTDELRKNSSIHRFTQLAEFELANTSYLSEESLIGDVTINNIWLHQISKQFLRHISDTLGRASCATFLFLPHFDVICDLNRIELLKQGCERFLRNN